MLYDDSQRCIIYNDKLSIDVSALQLATGKPPLADMHPMRALFMIPKSPPPVLQPDAAHSAALVDFVSACMQVSGAPAQPTLTRTD